jgi:glycosyltransferase involved in cell wall biosynthesis
VCQVFHPDSSATSQLFSPLLRAFAHDYDIQVLTGFPSLSFSNLCLPRREYWQGIDIHRLGFRLESRSRLWRRLLGYAGFSLHLWLKLITLSSSTRVMATTNPSFNLWLLKLSGRHRRRRLLYFWLDIFPEGLIALNKLKARSFGARVWLWLNAWAFSAQDDIVVIGRDMVRTLNRYHIAPRQRVHYVPHWSAHEWDTPVSFEAHPWLERFPFALNVVFQYSGNMGLWHDPATLIQAFLEASAQRPQARLLMIGHGMRLQEAQRQASGSAKVIFLPYQPLEVLPWSLSFCHVALISMRSGLSGVAVPSKLYGILASGRAILALVPEDSEVALTVMEHQCGLVVSPEDGPGLLKAMVWMVDHPQDVFEMGRRAYHAYRQHYTLEAAKTRMAALLAPSWDERSSDHDAP